MRAPADIRTKPYDRGQSALRAAARPSDVIEHAAEQNLSDILKNA
jgi:hypothetical protein